MSVFEQSNTLAGPTIFYKKSADSNFSLSINRSEILLSDGVSEILVEIGGDGESGNLNFTLNSGTLSEREVSLIYEIAIYQYNQFQKEIVDEE